MLNRTEVLQVILIGIAVQVALHLPKMWSRKHLASAAPGGIGNVVATATELVV